MVRSAGRAYDAAARGRPGRLEPPQYVTAAATILQAEDFALVNDVLTGRISLLAAAAKVAKRAKVVAAVKSASDADLANAARTIGVDRVWDKRLLPTSNKLNGVARRSRAAPLPLTKMHP